MPSPTHGTFIWCELMTTDMDKAAAFLWVRRRLESEDHANAGHGGRALRHLRHPQW